MHKVSIIVINYFCSSLVAKLIDSVERNIVNYEYEVLIFDNSVDASERKALDSLESGKVRCYFSNENIGFVKGNNCLIGEALGDVVILLNPDTYLFDSSIENAIKFSLENSDVAVTGPMLLNEDYTYQVSFYKFPTILTMLKEHILLYRSNPYKYDVYDRLTDCEVIKGACLIIRRDIIQKYGLFDEDLVMYSEEVEFCYRMIKCGFRNVYFPDARIVHYGKKSSSLSERSYYSLYHYYRSKLLFVKKNFISIKAFTAKLILYISLIEKTIILRLVGKTKSSKNHFKVFNDLLNGY